MWIYLVGNLGTLGISFVIVDRYPFKALGPWRTMSILLHISDEKHKRVLSDDRRPQAKLLPPRNRLTQLFKATIYEKCIYRG